MASLDGRGSSEAVSVSVGVSVVEEQGLITHSAREDLRRSTDEDSKEAHVSLPSHDRQ